EIVLVAALLPFLAATVDLFARCRRRHIPTAPGLRSYRSRLGFWLWCGVLFGFLALVGAWPGGAARPPSLASVHWPTGGLLVLAGLAGVGWLVGRDRLIPRRRIGVEEEVAGHTAAFLALGIVGLLVAATNPFALIFLLPSLHAWLWLPQLRGRPAWARAALVAAGYLGPLILLGSLAWRYDLGLDAPWYLAEPTATGYVKLPALVIAAGR